MFNDLTGQMFGKLKVIERAKNRGHQTYWICECQCENKIIKEVRSYHLTSERIKSCGCLYKTRKRSKVPPNTFEFIDNFKVGYTDTEKEFYYDICDSERVEKYKWYFDKDGYVIARINGKGIKLHKFIMNTTNKVDHKNRKRFDNRRSNLREASNSQNGMNIDIKCNNTSGVTGVGWQESKNAWRARISIDGEEIFLGLFNNFNDAVKARQETELKYFGEFSPLYQEDN